MGCLNKSIIFKREVSRINDGFPILDSRKRNPVLMPEIPPAVKTTPTI